MNQSNTWCMIEEVPALFNVVQTLSNLTKAFTTKLQLQL